MIPTRAEKLKFIVEEMQLAFHLAMQLTTPSWRASATRHFDEARRKSTRWEKYSFHFA